MKSNRILTSKAVNKLQLTSRLELMAKIIRTHPTSNILVLEPICWTVLLFSGFGPKYEPTCSSISDLLTSKKTGTQRQRMRMDHPFTLGFVKM